MKVVGEGFVEIVERGLEDSPEGREAVRKVIEPLLGTGVDRLVLGCTHYPFLRHHIEALVEGYGIEVVDSGEAVARRVEWLLERYDIGASKDNKPTYRFLTFADEEYRQRLEQRAISIRARL